LSPPHVPTFGTGRRRVCNAAVNRRSGPSIYLPKPSVRTHRAMESRQADDAGSFGKILENFYAKYAWPDVRISMFS
jgi:hypothetical protein